MEGKNQAEVIGLVTRKVRVGGFCLLILNLISLVLGNAPTGSVAPNRTVFCHHIAGVGIRWGFWYCLHILTSLLLFTWGIR